MRCFFSFVFVLCCSFLILFVAVTEVQAKHHHHVNGIKHVIALKVVHKKVKKYLPKLIKGIRVVPLPVPLHVEKQRPKGLVVLTPNLPDHLPSISPCKYAKYWHPKDLHGSGCEHAVGWS